MPPSTPEPEGEAPPTEACGISEVGLAMKTTPMNETTPATCSLLVNGSLIKIEQAQQATVGPKKVITVASERGKYCRESLTISEICISKSKSRGTHSTCRRLYLISTVTEQPVYHRLTAKETPKSTRQQEFPNTPWSIRGMFNLCHPLIHTGQDNRSCHSSEQYLSTISRNEVAQSSGQISPITWKGCMPGP